MYDKWRLEEGGHGPCGGGRGDDDEESGRDIRLGWRLGWRPGRTGGGRMDFGLGVEAARHEPGNDDAPENRVGLTAAMRW